VSINNIMDTMTTTPRRTRRRHSPELKTKILAECAEPGASVAKIAMAHGINANIVHSWRKRAHMGSWGQILPLLPEGLQG
jgi:transposase